MPLSAGEKLGPYEILAPIGAGGMGDVYKARDTRLDRIVAIKVSKNEFSDRFEREARAVAALNHSNICTLHDVGPNYLVMEYIEGAPLKGPLPIDQALKFAVQICDALDAAHKKGITHRDLKPANILVTKAGIKLLDFGLAKLTSTGGGQAIKPLDDLTLTMVLTGQNEIVGTLYYMSPEQLQAQADGQEIDGRSDIFSFGLVLYEMLTGKRAFQGSSPASVIAAIMERPAPSIADVAPAALDRVLLKCLAKDPDDRWQTARDLKDELQWIARAPESVTAVAAGAMKTSRLSWLWAIASVLAIGLGVSLWAPWRATQSVDHPLVRLDIDLGADVALPPPIAGGSDVVISPDGTRLAYVSGTPMKLFTRRLDQPKATELPGTEGATRPFFSPDGQWIGFAAGSKVNKISVDGGVVVPLADIATFGGGSWGEDGSIVLSDVLGKGLLRIPAGGGSPEVAVGLGSGEFVLGLPQILPGGKAILFVASRGGADALTIEVFTLADRHRKIVARGGNSPRYLATSNAASRIGYLAYVNKATLFAVPFDLDKLETRGTAVPVLDDVAYESLTGTGQLDFSRNGTLVYRRANGGAYAMTTVQWVRLADGPTGRNEPLRAKPGLYLDLGLSPDGKRVAMAMIEREIGDVWVYDPQRDAMARLTFGDAVYRHPTWSPDGKYVVFSSVGKGIFQARSDGAGQPQALTKGPQTPWSFTPDGKRLAYVEGSIRGQILTVPLEEQGGQLKAGKPEPFLKSSSNDQTPAFSPDGRWLAYQSNESGVDEVYVRPFPTPASGQGGKWPISNSGGTVPRWSHSRHELLYQAGNQILVASYTVKGDTFVAEKPRVWLAKLEGTPLDLEATQWDLDPDGKRVAVLAPGESAEAPKQEHEVVFVENFFDYLRRSMPVGK